MKESEFAVKESEFAVKESEFAVTLVDHHSQYRREGGIRGKFPGPGSQQGSAKSLIQTGELNNVLVGLKPLLPLRRYSCTKARVVYSPRVRAGS